MNLPIYSRLLSSEISKIHRVIINKLNTVNFYVSMPNYFYCLLLFLNKFTAFLNCFCLKQNQRFCEIEITTSSLWTTFV